MSLTNLPASGTTLVQAAAHLLAAADLADLRSDGDPFSPWQSFAGQVRLVAACATTEPGAVPRVPEATIDAHLHAALSLLDNTPLHDGPPDLPITAWRVADLRVLLRALDDLT